MVKAYANVKVIKITVRVLNYKTKKVFDNDMGRNRMDIENQY